MADGEKPAPQTLSVHHERAASCPSSRRLSILSMLRPAESRRSSAASQHAQQTGQQQQVTSPVAVVVAVASAGKRAFSPDRVISDYRSHADVIRFAQPSTAFIRTYGNPAEPAHPSTCRALSTGYARRSLTASFYGRRAALDFSVRHALAQKLRRQPGI